MEGLIPFVYRALTQHSRNGSRSAGALNSLFTDSPSMSYIRLPGDSGRFQTSDHLQLLASSDCSISSSSAPSNLNSSAAQSPLCRFSRRVAAGK
ncbi:hypothetical protein LINGRAHAP2_LOCUS35379 [Linum grandiflorum]